MWRKFGTMSMAKLANPNDLEPWLRDFPEKDQHRIVIAILGRTLLRVLPTNLRDNRFKATFKLRDLDRVILPNLIAAAHIWRSGYRELDNPGSYLWSGIYTAKRQTGYNLAVHVAKDLSYPDISAALNRLDGWGPLSVSSNLGSEIIDDASFLQNADIAHLLSRPLWRAGEPDWAAQDRMPIGEVLSDPIWEDWLQWYDRRVKGNVANEKIEDAFVDFPAELMDGDHYLINNEIRTRLGKQALPGPESELQGISIPRQRPAAVEPYWLDSRLVLPTSPAFSELELDTLAAALRSLRDGLFALSNAAEAESNVDKRAVRVIKQIAGLIPETVPPQDSLFTIAHGLEWLTGYQTTVNKEWPDVLAMQYASVAIQYDRTVRQFPRWREFVRNSELDRIVSSDEVAGAVAAAKEVEAILRDPVSATIVDAAIPNAFQRLASWLSNNSQDGLKEREDRDFNLLASDLLESIDNVAKRLAENTLKGAQSAQSIARLIPESLVRLLSSETLTNGWAAYRQAFAKEFPKAMERAGKEHANSVPSFISTAILFLITLALSGSGVFALSVAGASATARKFAWLGKLIELIKRGRDQN
jgi:hypothetical protein